jgi:DNA-binding transcriptional LysR family regulator
MPWQDRWGVLVRSDDALATRDDLVLGDLLDRPLIVSSQSSSGPDATLSFFAEGDFYVAATYTLLFNASLLVEQGVGVAVCLDGIVRTGAGTPFAFVPLQDVPELDSHLIWKRYQPLSRACEVFLRTLRSEINLTSD